MKAIAYVRYSTDQQGDGSTIQRQTASIEAYCAKQGLNLIATVKDEGKSGGGTHLKANLGKFLAEADAGKYRSHILVIEELDRLSRMGIHETNALIQRIWNAGLVIHLCQGGRGRIIAPGDDMPTAMLNIVESFTAAEKRRQLKDYAINGAEKRRNAMIKKGEVLNGLLPAWLKVVDGKVAEVTKPEGTGKMKKIPAATVRRVFELAAEGYGSPSIIEHLNGSLNGISPSWVNKTLANRAVLGEFKSSKLSETFHGYYPQIVNVELFRNARAQVDSKNGLDKDARMRACAGRNDTNNLFYKLAWDISTPGEPYRMARQAPYFMTQSRAGKGKIHAIRYDWFERAFRSFIRTNIDWHSIIAQGKPEELQTAESEQSKLANTVATLKSQIASKTELFVEATGAQEKILLGVIDSLQTKLANAEANLKSLTATVDDLKAKLANLESPERLFELLDAPDNADVRRKLKAEISKVVSRIDLRWCIWGGVKEVEVTATLINGIKSEYLIINLKTGETTFRATSSDSRTFTQE
jgi:DNA invertase Pin-like site-specific DNA recombinase